MVKLRIWALVFLCSESLYEDESFPQRELAALLASKVSLLLCPSYIVESKAEWGLFLPRFMATVPGLSA